MADITPAQQVRLWAQGTPLHEGDRHEDGQCCPDFSCCMPELFAPHKVRRAFLAACERGDRQTIDSMLGHFLAAAVATAGKRVYVAGQGLEQ